MKRFVCLMLVGMCGAAGCTNLALRRNTLEHLETTADLRCRQVLSNLALFDAVPYSLPSYSTIYTGTTKISDQGTANTSTVIGRETISKGSAVIGTVTHPQQETLDTPMQRQVTENWTLDPTSSPEKLLAMRACCQWVLYGPPFLDKPSRDILKKWDPEAHMPPGHYFALEDELLELPVNWLGRGCLRDVPAHAMYSALHGDRWVWVTASGMAGLSKFSLIFSKIAQLKTDEWYFPKPETRTITFVDTTKRDNMKVTVTAYIDNRGRLVSGDGKRAEPFKSRLENIGSDSVLRSTINAAAAR